MCVCEREREKEEQREREAERQGERRLLNFKEKERNKQFYNHINIYLEIF
jgi:hypothetical protein